MSIATYPVKVDATLDPSMSRWLWLVKWLLAIPHYILLFFLWVAFVVVSILAFFVILFTGRYPRELFDFNVGVLRWTWRVAYYTYGALGTDRYPPFTLADVPEYPAHFDVSYPEHLSRGLVLVKWWLLAIPHYLVVGFFAGGTWALWETTDHNGNVAPGGLIGLLVLIAAVALLFTGRYPEKIFDFVLGMNRWALRVAAYAGLMTDEYPPFRLDMGGPEPAGTMTVSSTPTAAVGTAAEAGPAVPAGPPPTTGEAPPPPEQGRGGWTAGRVVSLVVGCVLGLIGLGLLGAGGVATWATSTQRDAAGYLTSDRETFTTTTYAVTSDGIDLGTSADWVTPSDVLGTLRFRATNADPTHELFIGVAPRAAVETYLARVNHLVVTNWAGGGSRTVVVGAAAPRTPPTDLNIWAKSVAGSGRQTLTWKPSSGEWMVVVMNANGDAGVSVLADAGATVPHLGWLAAGLFSAGAIFLIGGVLLVAVPVARASR